MLTDPSGHGDDSVSVLVFGAEWVSGELHPLNPSPVTEC